MGRRLHARIANRLLLARHPVAYARRIGVTVGSDCRLLGLRPGTFGSEPFLVKLGDHVTVTGQVQFVTHDGGVWVFRQAHPDVDVIAPIRVGNNVFLGYGALIMPGVTIGDDCVIGARSVVTRDIPGQSVAVGSPAKVVKSLEEYREDVLAKALHIRSMPYWQKRQLLENKFHLEGWD